MSYGSPFVVSTDHEGALNGARLFLLVSWDVHEGVKVNANIPLPVCMPDSGFYLPRPLPTQFVCRPSIIYISCLTITTSNGCFSSTGYCTLSVDHLPRATPNISRFISFTFVLLNKAGGSFHIPHASTSKDKKGSLVELRELAYWEPTHMYTKGSGAPPPANVIFCC